MSNKMNLIKNTKEYFSAFSNKNIQKLNLLYADSISLTDWVDSADGKANVIEMNKNLFQSFENITVLIQKIHCDKNVASCEIEIILDVKDKRTILKVVDIIEYDNSSKIVAIRAYLGGESEVTKPIGGNMGPYDFEG